MSDAYRAASVNAVLVRDDVGRARKTCYDLPDEGHAYGRAEPADLEGAREVVGYWAAHVPRAKKNADVQDFRKINKLATKNGISDAKNLAQFRRENDVKVLDAGPQGPLPKVIPSDVIPSFAYGRKSRPSTPVASVVGMQYAAEYEEALNRNYEMYEYQKGRDTCHRVKLTQKARDNNVNARERRRAEEEAKTAPKVEPFKLSKFKKVSSRLALAGRSASMPTLKPAEMSA
eukprot:TRINITY_DN40225_c0_g1_i1.p2 TRINITY_DN40225_c0_g1~~TRINITY_DN40225_c0_g1_i1.p2  ORF type:complete len:231 (+),score=53.80 TRINITY_DN40225_c0_g1_i1:125-817(+)